MADPTLGGGLLPESVMHTRWFAVLAAFVAVNTVIYVSLSVFKIFPVLRRPRRGWARRSETRSIYPDGPL